jgi:hypothetical protein
MVPGFQQRYLSTLRGPATVIILSGILLFLTFNKHSRSGVQTYHSEIWGDKAGYYVYLPAAFLYAFDGSRFPENIDSLTGNGFRLDREDHRVLTKYTCGVAVLLSPFFLITHALTVLLNAPQDGFSLPYHRMIDVAAIFYLLAGFLAWYLFLRKYFSRIVSVVTMTALFLGTNLYYYAVDETGMSHIYSFFLFSLYLLAIQHLFSGTASSRKWAFTAGVAAAMIVLVRPVNAVFLPVALFLDVTSRKEIVTRIAFLLKWKNLLILIPAALLVFLPQGLYWHYAYGHYLTYTYQGEGFTNLFTPRIIEYLFSTNNGLLIYSPILLLVISGMVLMLLRQQKNGWMTAAMFIITVYLFSSWWNWYYGCGYGNRSFTEYLSLMALPFGFQINTIWTHSRKGIRWLWIIVICLLILLNLKMIYSWDGCWYGTTWDWERFIGLLLSAPK